MTDSDEFYSKFEPVPGFPGYTCNRKGEVRGISSNKHPFGKLLKPSLGGKKGTQRLKVNLLKDGVSTTIKIHTIIGTTFLGPKPFPTWSIDHIDPKQPLNNHITNLRWASPETQNANTLLQKDNTSGARGLIKHVKKGWNCLITHEGTRYRAYFIKKYDAFEWLRLRRIDLGLSVNEDCFGRYIPESSPES